MYDMWGVEMNFDNASTKSILGINFKDNKESLKAMVDSLIASGYIPAAGKKKK